MPIEHARAERVGAHGVDALDQPAVEEGKALAKQCLADGTAWSPMRVRAMKPIP